MLCGMRVGLSVITSAHCVVHKYRHITLCSCVLVVRFMVHQGAHADSSFCIKLFSE